jgi:CheY-like chemotaxis protein
MQREVLVRLLDAHDYAVDRAANGLEALRMVKASSYDIVLMDLSMPEINGTAAAKLISEMTHEAVRPKIIALTNNVDLAQSSNADGMHFFDAIEQKPWKPQKLLKTLRRFHRASPRRRRRPAMEDRLPPNRMFNRPRLPEESAPPIQYDPPDEPTRVLVVDDDELFNSMLVSILRRRGYDVEAATDGVNGMRLLREFGPDIAILDYKLPDIDGLALAKLTHEALPSLHWPRLIALTATPESVESRETGAPSIFDDVIWKAAGPGPIIESVERASVIKKYSRPLADMPAAPAATDEFAQLKVS